jgi:lambda family phage portal protein
VEGAAVVKLAVRPPPVVRAVTALDRFTAAFAPRWTLERVRARAAVQALARHYEAAQYGRRTSGWARSYGDANTITFSALAELRLHARDLVRNNGWARRAQTVISNNTVGGWGLTPRPLGSAAKRAGALWKAWADTTDCDAAGQMTFGGIQRQVVRALVTDGEVLVRRRPRRLEDGLAVPLQLQVLEADYIDTVKDGFVGLAGGPIIQGIEFDKLGRRAAYWLFPNHPGSTRYWLYPTGGGVTPPNVRGTSTSVRVPASEVLHLYDVDRPGQVRGVSWFGAGVVPLKELDEYEDAELVRQKIAACFAAFVTDIDGSAPAVGATETETEDEVETFEPGMISHLPPGKNVTFGNPPTVVGDEFTVRALRKVAAALGVTYEDLTGDYSQVNFSSARLGRLAHWANVRRWQWDMLVPACARVWRWAMDAAELAGLLAEVPGTEWTAPPMPMHEPDREGLALQRLVRGGFTSWGEAVREQGGDPDAVLDEIAESNKKMDDRGVIVDSDPRRVSQAGLTQERVGGKSE